MRIFALITLLLINYNSWTQSSFPTFLIGTWKVEGADIYEQWDSFANNHLRGLVYKKNTNNIIVLEYLALLEEEDKIILTTFVKGQNNGAATSFLLQQENQYFIFENQLHDAPKKIIYEQIHNDTIAIHFEKINLQQPAYRYIRQSP